MKNFKDKYLKELFSGISSIDDKTLNDFASEMIKVREKNGTVFMFGNGGSSANPSHSAGDWTKELGLKTICLTDNTSSVTAFANDTDYTNIFKGQLKVFLSENDLVIGYSGSGNSGNVIEAIKFAKSRGNKTIGVTGNYNNKGGGELAKICDICIYMDTISMEVIEDGQLIVNHIVKEFIKEKFPN